MKGLLLVSVFLVLFSGCSTMTPNKASTMSDYHLCRKYWKPLTTSEDGYIVQQELNRRGTNCSQYLPAYQDEQQTYRNMYQQGMEMLKPPPTTTCVTNCLPGAYGPVCTTTCR